MKSGDLREEQPLALDRSLSAMKDDIRGTELSIQRMMREKGILQCVMPSLDKLLRTSARLDLSLSLFLESVGVKKSIKEYVLGGKLLDAYLNFIKYEKCRNDLLELAEERNSKSESKLIASWFEQVEVMAREIRDVMRLTLSSINECRESTIGQIQQIVEMENRLDEESDMQKKKGKSALMERPRKWGETCLQILNDQLQRSPRTEPAMKLFQKQLTSIAALPEANNLKEALPEEDGYREELAALNKYFCDLRSQQLQFSDELGKVFAIDEIFKEARSSIVGGNILYGYERLIKAESARFHLLSEACTHDNTADVRELIEAKFDGMEDVFEEFAKEAKYYCVRSLDIMRGNEQQARKQLEIVLSIIELDSKIDDFYANANVPNSKRPHQWRKRFFDVIEERVQQRIEVFQIEDKTVNENWITRYLEICRMFIIEDLYAAKQFLRVFPKEHELYNRFVLFFHTGISRKLCEIATGEMEKRELVQLLSWIHNYPGEQLLGMPFLEINAAALVVDYPLIPASLLAILYKQFVTTTEREVSSWATKAVNQELPLKVDELRKSVEEDKNGTYYTQLPYILFSIIADQMALASEVSDELAPQILEVCVNEFNKVALYLENAINDLKARSYADKEQQENFTAVMIAVANNLDMCAESTEKLKRYLPKPEATDNDDESTSVATAIVPVQPTVVLSYPVNTVDNTPGTKAGRSSGFRGAMSALKDITKAKFSTSPSSSSTSLKSMVREESPPKNGREGDKRSTSSEPLPDESEQLFLLSAPENSSRRSSLLSVSQSTSQLTTIEKIDKLKESFESTLRTVVHTLYEEVNDDLTEFFEAIFTKQWLKSSSAIDTICETILDYYGDHRHLRPAVRADLVICIEFRLLAEYLVSIASREITCSDYAKRCSISKMMNRDVQLINATFEPILTELNFDDSAFHLTDVLISIAEFLVLRDKGMLTLEAASLLRKYPDMPFELLFSLIDVRDDVTRHESKALSEECFQMVDRKGSSGDPLLARLFQMSKGERKTSQIIKDVMPRLRRRVKLSIT